MSFRIAAALVLASWAAVAQTPKSQVVVSGDGYFPVLVRLRSGELLAVLRGGAAHIGVKGRLDLVSSSDGGRTWSKPWTAIDEQYDDRNPAMGQMKDGSIVLAYAVASGYDESGLKFKSRSDRNFDGVYIMRSTDKGKTWSRPKRDDAIHRFYAGQGLVSPYGKIVQTADGTALMAVYFEFFDERKNESYVFRSKDGGQTWGDPVLIGKHYNETALTVLPGGDLLAAVRSEQGGHLAISRSGDGGRTWSAPQQITKDREHPADLIVLRDGRVLLTYGERNEPRGVHATVSADNGKTWKQEQEIVLANDAPNTDCGYPSSVETDPGRIVTMYYQVDELQNAPASAQAKAVVWQVPK